LKAPQLALLLGAAAAAGTAGLWLGARLTGPAAVAPDAAVPIALPDLQGRTRSLAEFRGRPVLVNFWASWCKPCIEEMPMLEAFARSQGANGTQVVGIALDERGPVEAFLRATPVSYPVWLDTPGANDSSVRLGNARGVLPYSVLLDAQGRVAKQKVGPFAAGELEAFAVP